MYRVKIKKVGEGASGGFPLQASYKVTNMGGPGEFWPANRSAQHLATQTQSLRLSAAYFHLCVCGWWVVGAFINCSPPQSSSTALYCTGAALRFDC